MSTLTLKTVFLRLYPIIKKFQKSFLLGIALIIASTSIEMIMPVVVGRSVDLAVTAQGQPQKDFSPLLVLCLIYLGLILVRSLLESVQAYVIQVTGQGMTHTLRSLLFEKTESLPVSYFDKNPTGRLLTRVINDIKSLSELFTASFSVLALDAMIIVGTVIAMLLLNWKLALLILLTFPAVIYTIYYFGEKLSAEYRKVRAKLAEINGFLGENISAIATIQRLGAEKERFQKFETVVTEHRDAQLESIKVFAMVQPWANVLNGVAMSTLIGFGGVWVIQGQISIGVLVAFLGYLRNLFQPIRDLVEKYNTFLSAMVSAERVVNILDEPSEGAFQKEKPFELNKNFGVTFENVSFQYASRHVPAIQNVSFNISSGKSLAIVGATGSGKSTIIRLLLKFYDPTDGRILFGKEELSLCDRKSVRRQIGVVHQEIYLFGGTIRENLTLGRDGFSDTFLKVQCQKTQLWDFIENRGGLDMSVYEGGANLSLGERQLLSLARILVFDPPVLILDEATASIDRVIERRILKAFDEILSNRTSIVIAHRLTTIERCDEILVLEKGKIVEQGTYVELLKKEGVFRRFHEIHI